MCFCCCHHVFTWKNNFSSQNLVKIPNIFGKRFLYISEDFLWFIFSYNGEYCRGNVFLTILCNLKLQLSVLFAGILLVRFEWIFGHQQIRTTAVRNGRATTSIIDIMFYQLTRQSEIWKIIIKRKIIFKME